MYVRPSATLLDLDDEPASKIYEIDNSDDEDPDFPPFNQRHFTGKATEAAISSEPENTVTQAEKTNYASLADELHAISASVLSKDESTELVVRRRRIWDETLKKISMLDELKNTNVKFVGEDAAD